MTEAEFLPLFDRYHNMVYRLALSCTRSPQDAEDAVQTVFLKLLDGRTQPMPGKEKAWLAQVTVNASRDILRANRRRSWEPLDADIPFTQPEESALFDAVMALPDKYRAVVHLHYFEGYSYTETAQILRTSPSAVSMRLHRARKLLRSSLEEDEHETAIPKDL